MLGATPVLEILHVALLIGIAWTIIVVQRLTRRTLDHAIVSKVSDISAEAQLAMQEVLRTELQKFDKDLRAELRYDMDNLHARLEHLEQQERERQGRESRERHDG